MLLKAFRHAPQIVTVLAGKLLAIVVDLIKD